MTPFIILGTVSAAFAVWMISVGAPIAAAANAFICGLCVAFALAHCTDRRQP